MPNAERVWIDSDERGLELWVETDEDEPVCFNIHNVDLDTFYDNVKSHIGSHLRERDEALTKWEGARFTCDPDESGGYDVSDPKHPAFHSTHADIWDAREGK